MFLLSVFFLADDLSLELIRYKSGTGTSVSRAKNGLHCKAAEL
jgi:hypothetical protein